eukprot:6194926-Pleurochrysis_carterae.AAC.1
MGQYVVLAALRRFCELNEQKDDDDAKRTKQLADADFVVRLNTNSATAPALRQQPLANELRTPRRGSSKIYMGSPCEWPKHLEFGTLKTKLLIIQRPLLTQSSRRGSRRLHR